jgi:hypothetical protein
LVLYSTILRDSPEEQAEREAAVIGILLHTPWWVFVVFALLLALGIQALRPRVVSAWRLLVTPGIFIAWGLVSLAPPEHLALWDMACRA